MWPVVYGAKTWGYKLKKIDYYRSILCNPKLSGILRKITFMKTTAALIVLFCLTMSFGYAAVEKSTAGRHAGGFAVVQQTVDSINNLLGRYASDQPKLRMNAAGLVLLTTTNHQFYSFNLLDLENSLSAPGVQVDGIEWLQAAINDPSAGGWIKFNVGKKKVGAIRFENISPAELAGIHRLFVNLRTCLLEQMYG